MRHGFLALALVAAFAAGCSSSSAGTADAPPPADPATPGDDAGADAGDPTAIECESVRAALKPALDTARTKSQSTDVSVGVRTRGCPFVSVTSGPSKIAPDALYRVASITKTYTSTVILHFVAQGAVGLDEPIARFALGVPNEATITLRQLLDHTSGVFDYTTDPGYPTHLDWTPEERIQIAAKHTPYGDPGVLWHYSNTNFIALGLIAEKLGNAKIGALIRTIVLEPHALHATFFDGEETVAGTIAPSFGGGTPLAVADGRFGAWADGAIVASLSDLTSWMRTYASGEATPTLKDDLMKGVREAVGVPETYGLALEILGDAATGYGTSYGHGGDIPGFHSLAYYFPSHEWTIAAFVNDDAGDPNVVMLATLDALHGAKK